MILIARNCFLLARVLVKVSPASTVEPAKRFTKLTTTDVPAQETTLAKAVRFRNVSYFIVSMNFP